MLRQFGSNRVPIGGNLYPIARKTSPPNHTLDNCQDNMQAYRSPNGQDYPPVVLSFFVMAIALFL